jgi:hypothetical protein
MDRREWGCLRINKSIKEIQGKLGWIVAVNGQKFQREVTSVLAAFFN